MYNYGQMKKSNYVLSMVNRFSIMEVEVLAVVARFLFILGGGGGGGNLFLGTLPRIRHHFRHHWIDFRARLSASLCLFDVQTKQHFSFGDACQAPKLSSSRSSHRDLRIGSLKPSVPTVRVSHACWALLMTCSENAVKVGCELTWFKVALFKVPV